MIDSRLLSAFVLALCMFSLYGATFSAPYLSDDYWLIANASRDLSAWGIVEGLVTPLPEEVEPRFYREAWRVSYFLDIAVFDLDPLLSRLFNGLLHLANGFVLYLLYKKLLGRHGIALLGAALFVVFPVHVGAVAWVAARCDLLAVLFSLWALNLYAGALRSGFSRRVQLGIGLCVFLACHSKETGLISVPALMALHWFFSPSGAGRDSLGARLRDVWAGTWWVWAWLAVYMAMRYWVLGAFLGGYEGQREASVTVGGVVEHLGLYAGALAFPITSLQAVVPDVAVALLVGAGLVVTYMAVGSACRLAPACRFSILWTMLTLVPLYGINYAAPRHLYYPAVAWCPLLVLVLWIVSAGKRPGWPWIYLALCGSLIGYSWISSQASILPYREGAAVGAEVIDQARSILDENDGKPVVLYDVPDSVGPCYVGRNAFPNSCWPPFHSDRGDPFVGMTETRSLLPKFEQVMVAIAFRSDSLYFKWSSELGVFLRAEPRQLSPIVVRGKLSAGEGGILHLIPASIRVVGETSTLGHLVDQFVILEGERVGSQEPPVLSVRDARRAEPMLALANEGPVSGSVTLSITGEPGDAVGLWASAERGLFPVGSAGTLLLEKPLPWHNVRVPTGGALEVTFEIPPSVRPGEVYLQALIYRRGEWQLGDLLVVEIGG